MRRLHFARRADPCGQLGGAERAELAKVPYMLVLGDREIEAGGAAVRSHADGELGMLSASELAARIGSAGEVQATH